MTLQETYSAWQQAVIEGRRANPYPDARRRATYPDDADPDTVALSERFRVNYQRARLLKALSFGLVVSRKELALASGIPEPLVTHEVSRACVTCGFEPSYGRGKGGKLMWAILRACDASKLRDVIRESWNTP